MIARFESVCPRCNLPIRRGRDQVVRRHGDYIHTHCAPGACDE